MGVLFGTALLALVLALHALFVWTEPGARYRFFAGVFYVVGAIAVTAIFNVPRNIALGTITPGAAGSAEAWARYLVEWCAWNHVRAVTSIAAALLFTLALTRRGLASHVGPAFLGALGLLPGCNTDQLRHAHRGRLSAHAARTESHTGPRGDRTSRSLGLVDEVRGL
jgi:hypothetical protein